MQLISFIKKEFHHHQCNSSFLYSYQPPSFQNTSKFLQICLLYLIIEIVRLYKKVFLHKNTGIKKMGRWQLCIFEFLTIARPTMAVIDFNLILYMLYGSLISWILYNTLWFLRNGVPSIITQLKYLIVIRVLHWSQFSC